VDLEDIGHVGFGDIQRYECVLERDEGTVLGKLIHNNQVFLG
jgi:hypothetical protein